MALIRVVLVIVVYKRRNKNRNSIVVGEDIIITIMAGVAPYR